MAGFDLNFSVLGNPAQIASGALSAFDQGRKHGRSIRTESALARYAQGDRSAMAELQALDPRTALTITQLETSQRTNRRAGERDNAIAALFAPDPTTPGIRQQPTDPYGGVLGQPSIFSGSLSQSDRPALGATDMMRPQSSALAGIGMPSALPSTGSILSNPGADEAITVTGARPVLNTTKPLTRLPQMDASNPHWQQLAQIEPELAMKLRDMSRDDTQALYKGLSDNLDLTGRIVGSVRSVPEDERPAAYARLRRDLTAQGMTDLPEAWDEDMASAHLWAGMKAKEQVSAALAGDRLEADMADDAADNVRADRDAGDRIVDRRERRGLTARGQNMADARGRRGQDVASVDRRRGQDMTEARGRAPAPAVRGSAAGAGVARGASTSTQPARSKIPVGTIAANPATGKKIRWTGSAWVPA